jgi:pyruvate kinase
MTKDLLFNKTKIVATIGPASNNREMLKQLIINGVDVFRLNFSHGSHQDHQDVLDNISSLNEELGTHVCILQDLQGPKIRIGKIENEEVFLEEGATFVITTDEIIGTAQMVSTTYKPLPSDVKIDDAILIDDGKIEVIVTGLEKNQVITRVIHGGPLKPRKGINLPDTEISAPSLTRKDRIDLEFGLSNEVAWIALSFVRTANDVRELQEIIRKAGKSCKVIAKIEKPQALKEIDDIIEVSDGLMVARGDLGVETIMEDVPMVQKLIVSKCNRQFKPVIIATQMMESMIDSARPTRAETNDIANSIIDGADALMLSAETAVGRYPIHVVKSMSKTIQSVENKADIYFKHRVLNPKSETYFNNNLILSACRLARDTGAVAITGLTESGYTAYRLAGNRPKAHIFVFTHNKTLPYTLNLVWGVRSIYYDKMESTDATFSDIETVLREKGCLKKGEVFINTASMPIHARYRTNSLKISIAE